MGHGRRIGLRYDAELETGQTARFARTIATYTSRDPDTVSVERSCLAALRNSATWQPGVLRRRHVAAWRRRWETADIEIDGPEEDQRAIRFAIAQLIAACSSFDPTVSIGAKALSGEAYRGHVFWDTEIFMLPFFVYTDPAAARRLLEYRRHTLDGARTKARENGYQGAMFAWESADTGEETCPLHVPDPKTGQPVPVWCGRIEHHITADVAYAAWHLWQATGDDTFLDSTLRPIAVETARFWASRVESQGSEFVIRDVIGPDEYHEHVDDNAFTNHMAAWNLRLAAYLAPHDPDAARWRNIADAIRIPFDQRRGIIAQDDSFLSLEDADPHQLSARVCADPEKARMARIWRSQVLKQADVVMLLMLWPDAFPRALKRRCWSHYAPRTTHDSSLSASAHAIVASDLALRRKAYDYFRFAASTDLADPMGNTADGLHAAALGGTWQAVVRGLLGIRTAGVFAEDASRGHHALGGDASGSRSWRRSPPAPRQFAHRRWLTAGVLCIDPHLPRLWRRAALKVRHRGALLALEITRRRLRVQKLSGKKPSAIRVGPRTRRIRLHHTATFPL